MHDGSNSGSEGLRPWLDRAEVLEATVRQLRKDLSLIETELPVPPAGEDSFERLRGMVRPVLEALNANGWHALHVAMYRVDIPEKHLRRTLEQGGMEALSGETVLRCLQKVLTRLRHAGRY